eukprot:881333_1
MLAFVQFLLFVISCYSAQLKTDYAVDETFSVANSPYYVSADAVIRDGVTITVENGVEIIFMDVESEIAAKVSDICDGYSRGLVTFWPYFESAIDMSDLINLPSSASPAQFVCSGVDNGHDVVGSKLNVIYVTSTTWSVSGSPYYVVNDIVIADGVAITIEDGVEIIFMADYTIYMRGTFDFCTVDTSNNMNRGLHDATTYGYIHADSSLVRKGSIVFDSGTMTIPSMFVAHSISVMWIHRLLLIVVYTSQRRVTFMRIPPWCDKVQSHLIQEQTERVYFVMFYLRIYTLQSTQTEMD